MPEEAETDFGQAPQFVQPLEETTPVEEDKETRWVAWENFYEFVERIFFSSCTISRLTVKVTGIPKPVVRWFSKDKQLVQTSEVTIVEEEEDVVTLVIKKMKPEFIGPITCEAHNELGVISTSTVLHFPGKFSLQ